MLLNRQMAWTDCHDGSLNWFRPRDGNHGVASPNARFKAALVKEGADGGPAVAEHFPRLRHNGCHLILVGDAARFQAGRQVRQNPVVVH